jgi:DNA repair protein RecN (Recombination protein N)
MSEQNKADLDYFQFQFDELEKAGLVAGEQEELEQEQSELTHAEEIKRSLLISIGLLSENEPSAAVQIKEALDQFGQCRKV